MPKFSIIIPVYNVAPYLRECLNSVLGQAFTDWEAVCVDDGSTDGSSVILDEYAERDSHIKVIHRPNAGVSAARNCGLELASGDWICFMDSDDVITADALETIVRRVNASDCDMIVFGMQCVRDVGEKIGLSDGSRETVYDMADYGDAAAFVRKNFPHRLWAWNKCFKRELIGDLRFRNFQPCEDAIWVLECLCRAKKVLELPNVLYKYLQHEGSCLATVNYKRMNGDIQGMRGLCDVMLSAPFFEQVRPHVYRELLNVLLFRIPYNIEKLNKAEERAQLTALYFKAAKHVFVESRLGSSCSRLFYWMLLLPRSLSLVKEFLTWRNRFGRVRACFFRLFGCGSG